MDYKFKTCYLVCFDCSDDVNYVISRTNDLSKARKLAKIAKRKNPDSNIYITVEKVCKDDVLGDEAESVCRCGKITGECIGDLSCRCNPYAMCKLTDTRANPLDPFYSRHRAEEDEDDEDDEDEENPYFRSRYNPDDEDIDEDEENESEEEEDEGEEEEEEDDEDETHEVDNVEENPYLPSAHGINLEYDYTRPPESSSRYNPYFDEYDEEDDY